MEGGRARLKEGKIRWCCRARGRWGVGEMVGRGGGGGDANTLQHPAPFATCFARTPLAKALHLPSSPRLGRTHSGGKSEFGLDLDFRYRGAHHWTHARKLSRRKLKLSGSPLHPAPSGQQNLHKHPECKLVLLIFLIPPICLPDQTPPPPSLRLSLRISLRAHCLQGPCSDSCSTFCSPGTRRDPCSPPSPPHPPKKGRRNREGERKKAPWGARGGWWWCRPKPVTSAAPLSSGPRTVVIVPPYQSRPIHTETYSWIHCFLYCLDQPVD